MREWSVYGGGLAGVLMALTLWYRVDLTIGPYYPLDVSAVMIVGVLVISALIGIGVYWSLGGELENPDPEASVDD